MKGLLLVPLLAVLLAAGTFGAWAAPAPKVPKAVVLLDPGHGGAERGVKADGMEEAAYTLALAQKVAEALKKDGFDARLTRDSDVALSAASRSAMAGAVNAQALVSLHLNYSYNTQAHGLRVFVPAPGPVDEASAPLWEQAARLQAAPSRSLGQQIAAALDPSTGSGQVQKSVQTLKLALFRGLTVPAVEVELDYASNPESLAILAQPDAIAAKLAKGIGSFLRSTQKAEAAHAPTQP